MKPFAWMAILLAVGLAAASARADVPRKAEHRDPDAPCFRWPAVDMDGDGVYDRIDHCPNTPKGCAVDKWGCAVDSDGDGVCDGLDQCPNTPAGVAVDKTGCSAEQLLAKVAPPPAEPAPAPAPTPTPTPQPAQPAPKPEPPVATPAPTPPPATPPSQDQPVRPTSELERQLVERGVLRLENVYFETSSARLLPESEATLSEAGAALAKYPGLRVEVQGHTDTRGPADFNMKLSQERAESVRGWLLDHYQLRPGNVIARGYGKSRPETRERNDEELLRNRRVVLRVLNPAALPRNVEVEK